MRGEYGGERAVDVKIVPLDQRADRRGADDEWQVEARGGCLLRICSGGCHPGRSFPLRRAVPSGSSKPAKLAQRAKKRNGVLLFGSTAYEEAGFTKRPGTSPGLNLGSSVTNQRLSTARRRSGTGSSRT